MTFDVNLTIFFVCVMFVLQANACRLHDVEAELQQWVVVGWESWVGGY